MCARTLQTVVDLTLHDLCEDAANCLKTVAVVGGGATRTLRAPIITWNNDVPVTQGRPRMPSARIQAAVFTRDGYFCRYCNLSVVSLPVMSAIADIFPTIYRLHPKWKAIETDR